MKRRIFLSGLMALPFSPTAHAEQAWAAELLQGSFNGKAYLAGLHIMLQPGWKTYWRNPGEGGIPPDIKLEGDNLATFTIDAPLPTRIIDESGEAIGYHEEVVFPIILAAKDAAAPLAVNVKSFFGVCAKICTPAKFSSELQFQPISTPSSSDKLLASWIARVPAKKDFVTASSVKNGALIIDLLQPVDDIFVEGPGQYYFRKPDMNQQVGRAVIKVDGLKSDGDLKSANLRLTAAMQGRGIEQSLTLA